MWMSNEKFLLKQPRDSVKKLHKDVKENVFQHCIAEAKI